MCSGILNKADCSPLVYMMVLLHDIIAPTLLKARNAFGKTDTAVGKQRWVTLKDGIDARSSILILDGDHQVYASGQGNMITGDPYSCTVFGVRYWHAEVIGRNSYRLSVSIKYCSVCESRFQKLLQASS